MHRDLSPDNIILPGGKVERAKIIDFGIARSATIGGETLIGGSFAGKYNYVSPEQLGLYGGDVRERSDIYSLGLVLAAAMRGSPIDMGGSQMEVVEKRRVVPDLSTIHDDFRPIIEAMLQPNPADRPESMAEIARMTRDGPLGYVGTATAAPHDDRTVWTRADQSPFGQGSAATSAPGAGARIGSTGLSQASDEPQFVPYIPPAHLSQPSPAADQPLQAAPSVKSRGRNIALAAAAMVIVGLGAGAYRGGFLTPWEQTSTTASGEAAPPPTAPGAANKKAAGTSSGQQAATNPAPPPTQAMAAAEPPVSQAAPPPTADDAANPGAAATPTTPAPTAVAEPANVPATKADDQTPSIAATKQPPLPEMQGATLPQPAADDEAANSGAAAAPTPPAPTAGTALPVAEPANAPATKADDQTPSVPAVEQPPQAEAQSATPTQPTAAEPANAGTATPNAQLKPVAIEQPHQPDAQAAATAAPVAEPVDSGTPAGAGQAPAPLVEQPKQAATATEPVAEPADAGADAVTNVPVAPLGLEPAPAKAPAVVAIKPANATPQVAAPAVAAPATAPEQPETAKAEAAAPQAGPQAETVVAMNVPTPPATASDSIDTVADRISWLRDYHGGDCFYATVTSATDKAIEIEGFGTEVSPFEQMLGAFQAKFRVEPEVSVRLIEPAQCEITSFLHALSATAAKRPKLALDRTSVASGSAISGTLETVGGLRTSLLLIDNKGMAFNLDGRVTVHGGKAVFNVPISLGAVDRAAGKAVPQIIVAVTGAVDLKAAEFSKPTPASAVFSKILSEIGANGQEFAATAKYFRLGG